MCSIELLPYLDFIKDWMEAPDEMIERLLSEFKAFMNLGDYDPDPVIDEEFVELVDLAETVRDNTIETDVIKIVDDECALQMVESVALNMITFVGFKISEVVMGKIVSSKSKKLNKKLKHLDIILASKMSSDVKSYVEKYKANNRIYIYYHLHAGKDSRKCRVYMHQFIAAVYRKTGTIDIATFKHYAMRADFIFNQPATSASIDAIENVLKSNKRVDEKANEILDTVKRLCYELGLLGEEFLVMGSVLHGMQSNGMSSYLIKVSALRTQFPFEAEIDMGIVIAKAVGYFDEDVKVVASIFDEITRIINIVYVVEQCKKLCAQLEGPIKQRYKDYFNGIRESSKKFRKLQT